MSEYRIISSDNHVVEPPDLWTTRMGHKHGDRCPQLLNTGDGEFWYVDNMKTFNLANMASQPGRRFEEPQSLVRTEFWGERSARCVHRGGSPQGHGHRRR